MSAISILTIRKMLRHGINHFAINCLSATVLPLPPLSSVLLFIAVLYQLEEIYISFSELNVVPGRLLWTCRTEMARPLCVGLGIPRCVPWHYPPLHFCGHMLSTTKTTATSTETDPQKSTGTETTNNAQKAEKTDTVEDEEEYEGPEYIPKRKAKNPMMKIGYAWMIGLPAGIIGFIMTKREVDKNRLKQLRVRQRMKRSNEGEYDGSRYRNVAATKTD